MNENMPIKINTHFCLENMLNSFANEEPYFILAFEKFTLLTNGIFIYTNLLYPFGK